MIELATDNLAMVSGRIDVTAIAGVTQKYRLTENRW